MKSCLVAGAMALAGLSSVAMAQGLPKITPPSTFIPPAGVAFNATDGSSLIASPSTPLPVAARGEAFQLVTANVPIAPVTLAGGNYVLTQLCASYGTVALRYRGPDGATMIQLVSKTAADSGGGTVLAFGTNAIVDVALSGTTGCNVTLARIP